jgi:hypothetical protein
MHNTLWVPGHFYTYLLGMIAILLGLATFVTHGRRPQSEFGDGPLGLALPHRQRDLCRRVPDRRRRRSAAALCGPFAGVAFLRPLGRLRRGAEHCYWRPGSWCGS